MPNRKPTHSKAFDPRTCRHRRRVLRLAWVKSEFSQPSGQPPEYPPELIQSPLGGRVANRCPSASCARKSSIMAATMSWRPSLTDTSVSCQLAQTYPSSELKIISSSASHLSRGIVVMLGAVIALSSRLARTRHSQKWSSCRQTDASSPRTLHSFSSSGVQENREDSLADPKVGHKRPASRTDLACYWLRQWSVDAALLQAACPS